MIDIKELLRSVSHAVGDRNGCNDNDVARANKWIEWAESENPSNHTLLVSSINAAVAYGD